MTPAGAGASLRGGSPCLLPWASVPAAAVLAAATASLLVPSLAKTPGISIVARAI